MWKGYHNEIGKTIIFISDIRYMEIYSYVGASAAKKQSLQKEKIDFRYEKIASKRSALSLSVKQKSREEFPFSLDTSKTEPYSIDVFLAKLKFYFPLLLFLLILILVPVSVFKVLSYLEQHTLPLQMNQDTSFEFELLDEAMSRFAMDSVISDVDENGNVLAEDGSVLTAASVGVGQKVTFSSYTVKAGDSISTITRRFGLSNISTLIAINNISNVKTLRSGQKLKIPSIDGLVHKVENGESLNSLSVKYHVSVEELLDANDLSSETLAVGTELFIPGAKLDSTSLKKAMGELFVCPLKAKYRISSYFGKRKDPFTDVDSHHTGVDMACPKETPIYAAMSGTVAHVGWTNIFGNYVIIDHGNGYQTLYAHMEKALTKKGLYVEQSTIIGLVGSTGYSTGPHLHFTVYKNGKLVDPLSLIRR